MFDNLSARHLLSHRSSLTIKLLVFDIFFLLLPSFLHTSHTLQHSFQLISFLQLLLSLFFLLSFFFVGYFLNNLFFPYPTVSSVLSVSYNNLILHFFCSLYQAPACPSILMNSLHKSPFQEAILPSLHSTFLLTLICISVSQLPLKNLSSKTVLQTHPLIYCHIAFSAVGNKSSSTVLLPHLHVHNHHPQFLQ